MMRKDHLRNRSWVKLDSRWHCLRDRDIASQHALHERRREGREKGEEMSIGEKRSESDWREYEEKKSGER